MLHSCFHTAAFVFIPLFLEASCRLKSQVRKRLRHSDWQGQEDHETFLGDSNLTPTGPAHMDISQKITCPAQVHWSLLLNIPNSSLQTARNTGHQQKCRIWWQKSLSMWFPRPWLFKPWNFCYFFVYKHWKIQFAPFSRAETHFFSSPRTSPPMRIPQRSLLSRGNLSAQLCSTFSQGWQTQNCIIGNHRVSSDSHISPVYSGTKSSCKNTDLLQEGQNDLFP